MSRSRKQRRNGSALAGGFVRDWRRFVPSLEGLEGRRLMAVGEVAEVGDVTEMRQTGMSVPQSIRLLHNAIDPEDVNDDGECSPGDVLAVINAINAKTFGATNVFHDVNNDGECSAADALMVINRLNRGGELRRPRPTPTEAPVATSEVRSFDGTGNNLSHPDWGRTFQQLLRVAPAEYGDGVSTPAGADRPSAREISNALVAHSEDATPDDRNLTAYIYVFGQFLDHDLDLTGTTIPREPFNIAVPAGDETFDTSGSGTATLPLSRSIYDPTTGSSAENPRQQINHVTAWIDGSQIYGANDAAAASLRSFVGGKLKTSAGDFPPTDSAGHFLAGDTRANENIQLTSMHTLFVREHNRLAAQISAAKPTLTDEQVYQEARALVIAELQAITYNEWLPALLGRGAITPYRGYKASVNPGIANEFSTAAFRLHTTINDDVKFFDNEGQPITFDYVNAAGGTVPVEGEVALFEAFFNPRLLRQSGVDGVLKYAASTHMEKLDTQVVDSLRNFLFTQPSGGLDLASLNIQRGRDHGLADYNTVREAYGLPRVTSFAEIASDTEVQATLEQLYGSVDNIDLWVGGLADDHAGGSSVGPLIQRIIADQFQRLRDGDRFWYQRVFSGSQLAQIERTTLRDIIERNTGVEGLQNNVFVFRSEASGRVFNDVNGDGSFSSRRERGLRGIEVQLLDGDGEIIATARTGRDGRYRFGQFPETGDYLVHLVAPTGSKLTTARVLDLLISSGDQRRRGLNFGLRGTTQPAIPLASGTFSDRHWAAGVDEVIGGMEGID